MAIAAEWSSNRSFADRLKNIKVDSTGATFGQRLNGGYFLLGDDGSTQTVFSDGYVDKLTGNAGADWFLANTTNHSPGDNVLDIITDLGSSDNASDTDT